MPELPDISVYIERMRALLGGHRLLAVELRSPFVLRSVEPPPTAIEGLVLRDARRMGKRVLLAFDDDLYAVMHLMIAGRLRWRAGKPAASAASLLVAFRFDHGSLLFTEASGRKRASMHLVRGADALAEFQRGGLEVLQADAQDFAETMRRENHTLKRALTDPRIISGIGNAYSDEILHGARLSPFRQTSQLDDDEMLRLYTTTRTVLEHWTTRLREESGDGFPDKVTAFREGMSVHGRYGQPCPVCDAAIQRIVYAGHDANYCARCQTGGRMLADRALSRLLKANWPRTLEELEARQPASARPGPSRPSRTR